MSARAFQPVMARRDGQSHKTYTLTCGKCGVVSSGLVCDLVPKKFQQRGWEVGRREVDDRCPNCVEEAKKRSERKVIQMPQPELKPEPPRQMTREDKRLIIAKLDEVYDGEDRGYGSGWTDERVAKDMGIPRAWVSEIRVDLFGDLEMNEDIRAAAAREVTDMHKRLQDAMKDFEKAQKAAVQIFAEVQSDLKKMRERFDVRPNG